MAYICMAVIGEFCCPVFHGRPQAVRYDFKQGHLCVFTMSVCMSIRMSAHTSVHTSVYMWIHMSMGIPEQRIPTWTG